MDTPETTYNDYQPFPNEDGRNARQEHLEVPVFVHVLGIHPGARILVGCSGRGDKDMPILQRTLLRDLR